MKRICKLLPGLLLTLSLLACGGPAAHITTAPPQTTVPATTAPAVTAPPTTVPPTTVPPTTAPLHTDLYLEGCYPEQLLRYWEEVVLNVEYNDGTGNPDRVQKWLSPIRCRIEGEPTQEDRRVLEDFFQQLNQIPGFPGIHMAEEGQPENLTLSFLCPDDFRDRFSHVVNGEDAWGATEFWYYTDTNEIYTACIGYRRDIDQASRSSILLEEIVNTLGITDTVLREDSIVYQYSNSNLALSDVDWLLLKLLYHPAMECGMDAAQCLPVLQELYH